jgi:uncharacterized membrane protein YkvA (DUF1232 family)
VGYAFSPIDLIPDFIPVLGYVDDLVIVPLGITIAMKMIPANVMAECQARSREIIEYGKPVNKIAAVVIIGIWLVLTAWLLNVFLGFID